MWVKWKHASIHLETVLILAPDRWTVCAECSTGMEIFLDNPIDLLGDVGQMEACFGLFEDSINLDTKLVHSLRRTWNRLRNHFGHTR
jgi:hypothetical protein